MSRSDSDTTPDGGNPASTVPGIDYSFAGKSAADVVRDLYHVPALLAVVAFMLWVRLQSYGNFIRDGQVYFNGNDAWYHLRQVRYTVANWPSTMPFDPWSYYPFGTAQGQFGTLYDQLIATAALVVGLGSPSDALVAKTLLVAPAVFGALVAVPTYLIGKRLGGRLAGLFGAVILMLLPGTFLRRGLVGFADHNIAEPFFQAFAVVALMIALTVAQRDRPIWELVQAREWDELKPTLYWSALAGFGMGLYIWTWPPGVFLLGVFAAYVAFQSVSDYTGDRSPDHVAFVAVVSMAVAALMAVVRFQEASFSPSQFSLIQPLFALATAAGAVFLAFLARQFDSREFPDERLNEHGFPATVGVLAALGVLLVIVVDASPFTTVENNLLRFVGFSAGAATRTIGEAQPFLQSGLVQYYGGFGVVIAEYGFAFITALAAAVWMLVKPLWKRGTTSDYYYLAASALVVLFVFVGSPIFNDLANGLGFNPQVLGLAIVALLVFGAAARVRYDAEHLFVFVWAAFITAAAFTQVRFNYYLAVAVAGLNAYFLREILAVIGIDFSADLSMPDVETYQIIAVVLTVLVVLGPVLVVPLSLGNTGQVSIDRTNTAVAVGNSTGPGAVTIWDENLEWMNDNTPAEGNLGGAGNADDLDYYGTYQRPVDDDYDYPEGTYGVMSWWDYGHYITTQGERIPHANPFQQGASSAANYLLAPSEEEADEVLANIDDDGEAERMRYVMVDWQMVTVGSKFGAPVVFDDDTNASDYYSPTLRAQQTQQGTRYGVAFRDKTQRYYESQMVRLYLYHGSRADPTVNTLFGERVVVFDYDTVSTEDGSTTYKVLPQGENASAIRTFANESAAQEFVEEEGTAQIGGVGAFPRESVPAMEHYRLVSTSETSAYASSQYQRTVLQESQALGLRPSLLQQTQPQWVKTFEKVPGATVEGDGADPNETVTATVEMRVPDAGTGGNASTFTYEQQTTANEDGEFEFTVPYSTTGYDEYGPENGYTNVSVRATGAYTVTGEVESNESAYIVRNEGTFNVSEGLVNGDEDGTATVTLSEEVLRAPEGAQNGSETNNSTEGSDNSSSLSEDLNSLNGLDSTDEDVTTPDDDSRADGSFAGSAATGEAEPAVRAPTRSTVAP
ncbi:oligosaccharyl transferase, archaeosortase A system-associated [Halobaculum magnesiiphilum]|uniref:dolichyl-phosphooligosaccharide-protein glycotransferase n=1 Tax=Halobaculum magnesiiphilum TaxID=1017351 RepID=A0A8T8WCD1_9EURY|nr:oligosaccharyl transferase, archaeosortase A system-associated [Halobaculum magnesiiphilum]QZP37510.1 oligosaccharyl transferase, archaeosortase A system-associated [Halobaculum magnesiiphilum]